MSSQSSPNFNSTLQQSVAQALQNPSAYGSQNVMDSYNMLNQQLSQDYDYQRKQLNDELATRGLSESTIAGQRYSDLSTEQARAQANMATTLANQAALTYGQDRNSALQAGLGLGNLDLSQQLGLGNLGVAQQNANTGATSVANQYALGQGQLGISQQSQDLAKQLGLGNLGVSQGQLSLAQQQNAQNFGLQQADLTGSYNGQQTLASKAQQTAQQEFQQQLAQQLGIATMSDKTQNRGIDVQGQTNMNQLMMQLAMLGISGGMLTAATNGGGGTGSSTGSGSTGSGASSNPLTNYVSLYGGNTTAGSGITGGPDGAAMQANPALYAQLQLQYGDRSTWGNQTVNFNGQQLSVEDYYKLMAAHPEQFKANTQANQNAATNAASFANMGPQTGGGTLATQTSNYFQPTGGTSYANPSGSPAASAPSASASQTNLAPPIAAQPWWQTPLGAQGTPAGTLYYRDPKTGAATALSPEQAQQMMAQQQSDPYAMVDPDGINRFFLGQDPRTGSTYDPVAGTWSGGNGGSGGSGSPLSNQVAAALGSGSPDFRMPTSGSALTREQFFAQYPEANEADWRKYGNSFGVIGSWAGEG